MGAWQGHQGEKALNNFSFTVKVNVNAVAGVLKCSGRVPHKIPVWACFFSWTWCFLKLVPTMLLWWGCVQPGSAAACLEPFPPSFGSWSLVCWFDSSTAASFQGVYHGIYPWQHLVKVQSDTSVCVTKLWMQLLS